MLDGESVCVPVFIQPGSAQPCLLDERNSSAVNPGTQEKWHATNSC